MEQERKIKWGVLGTAGIARGCTIPGMKEADNCELYAIAGRSMEKAEAFQNEFGFEKAYGSYDELIHDEAVEAVYIPLPNNLHFPWVKAALKKKKHVLCEKPLAMNAAEAKEMFEIAEANGVFLMEAYAYLHSPYVQALKDEIARGILGEIEYVESAFLAQGHIEDFRLHKEFGGGAIYDLGCYSTTMILSLVDSEVSFVKTAAEIGETGVDLNAACILKFENGVRASFNAGMIFKPGTNARFDRLYIHGDKGSIRSEVEYNQSGDCTYRIITKDTKTVKTVTALSNYRLEVEQLGRCILQGEKPLVTPEFSLKNAKLLDRILEQV
jgi:predicted dehydrogenase